MPDQQSGGISVKAKKVDIGQDAVARDKVVNATYNYGVASSQPRRAELPHQPYFFGREEELARIADALDPEANGWGVLIDGPGGIGKTALAIRAGHLASDKIYPTKIFLSAKVRELTPQGEQKLEDFMLLNYVALLTELARELGDEGVEKTDPNERAKEVRRLLENRHALIIVDNLETFDEKERERLFQFLKRLPRSCKAIVTSRRRTDVAAEIIRLDRLKKDDALKLIAKLGERNRFLVRATDQERADLYEITKGSPLLIEWIVGQLGRPESNCRTIADAYAYIENVPPKNDPLEYIFGDLLGTFTDHETAVLAALTHFTQPAKVKWISDVAGTSRTVTEIALEDLADRALVVADVQSESFTLPPLVALFLRRKRPEIVIQAAERLTDRVFALVQENGDQQFERFPILDAEWPAVASALPLFLQGNNVRLQRLCNTLFSFLNLTGKWDERLWINSRAEERAVSAEDYVNAGWRAYNSGAVYFRRGQSAELLACAQRAELYWANAGAREKAYAIRLRGLGHQLENNYPLAMSAFREALAIDRALAPESKEVAVNLSSIAKIQRLSGDYLSAEENYRESLRIARKVDYREGVASITGNLADSALDRQDSLTAEELARESLALAEHLRWQKLIAENCCRIGEALAKQGRTGEGLAYAQRAVEIYAELQDRDMEKAQEILKECEE